MIIKELLTLVEAAKKFKPGDTVKLKLLDLYEAAKAKPRDKDDPAYARTSNIEHIKAFIKAAKSTSDSNPGKGGVPVWCSFNIKHKQYGDLLLLGYETGHFYDRFGEKFIAKPVKWAPADTIPYEEK